MTQESDYLHIRRVSYGKDSTPTPDREYRLSSHPGPVGTIKDWQDFAMFHGYVGLRVEEKNKQAKYVI